MDEEGKIVNNFMMCFSKNPGKVLEICLSEVLQTMGVWKVIGSMPVVNSDFFFVPCS